VRGAVRLDDEGVPGVHRPYGEMAASLAVEAKLESRRCGWR
jgi:hypothetical protein